MTNLLTLSPAEFCKVTNACAEGREFALRHQTMAEVWDACPRPEWLIWICERISQCPDDRTLRLFAIWCVRNTPLGDGRVTGDLITDPRLRAALGVVERYVHGRAGEGELSAAALAAKAAADDAAHDATRAAAALAVFDAVFDAAYAATARAATYAVGLSAAACAARDARRAAGIAAYDAVAHEGLATAARVAGSAAAAFRAQADQFRRVVANPFRT